MASSALQPTGKKAPTLLNGPKGQRKSRAQPNRKRKLLLTDDLPDMVRSNTMQLQVTVGYVRRRGGCRPVNTGGLDVRRRRCLGLAT